MRETLSVATMFLILAIAGMAPSHAQGGPKTCKAGPIAIFLELC